MRLVRVMLFIHVFSLLTPRFSLALETDTHEKINEFIVTNTLNEFSLDDYLRKQLGFPKGYDEKFTLDQTKKVLEWIKIGGKFEDVPPDSAPFIRSVNHFHNPINNKGFSGFFGAGLFSGESALQWSQKPPETQCPGGYYSWHDVRGYFL